MRGRTALSSVSKRNVFSKAAVAQLSLLAANRRKQLGQRRPLHNKNMWHTAISGLVAIAL